MAPAEAMRFLLRGGAARRASTIVFGTELAGEQRRTRSSSTAAAWPRAASSPTCAACAASASSCARARSTCSGRCGCCIRAIPLYVVPWGDGRYMVGATVIESDDAGPVTVRSALELLGSAYALHPAFAEAEIVEMGAGVRPAFADNVPKIVVRGRHHPRQRPLPPRLPAGAGAAQSWWPTTWRPAPSTTGCSRIE